MPALIPAHWPEQATAPGVAASFTPLELAPPRLRYLAFNARARPLDDARVRHALALLIDRRAIAKRVFDGLARPALWPIWPGGPVDGAGGAGPRLRSRRPPASCSTPPAGSTPTRTASATRAASSSASCMIGSEKPAPKDTSAPPVKTERDYFIEAARRIGVVIEVKTGGESWVEKHLDRRQLRSDRDDVVGGMVDSDLDAARRQQGSAARRPAARSIARSTRWAPPGIPRSAQARDRARRRARRDLADRGDRRRCAAGPRPSPRARTCGCGTAGSICRRCRSNPN